MAYYVHLRVILFLCLTAGAGAQQAIDFSYAGYGGGGAAIPTARAVLSVRPDGGDDTELLQGALDRVGRMTPGADGYRGAVLLQPGRYRVAGQLIMRTGGVVLRGSGGATIVATGKGRRTLIEIGGGDDAVVAAGGGRVRAHRRPDVHPGIHGRPEGQRSRDDHAAE